MTRAPAPSGRPFVVAIGASAGGFEALQQLLAHVTAHNQVFLVMQHLAPGGGSALAELLGRVSALPVRSMSDGCEIEVGNVYVSPASLDVGLQDGVLSVSEALGKVRAHPIDKMFDAVARDVGSAAVGVVLSGGGTDGSSGLRAIKEEGGITFVQDPATAQHTGMPQSALDSGCADFCLAPEAIAQELTRLANQLERSSSPERRLGADVLRRLFEQLNRAWGVDFSAYKLSTVQRRIERRMALLRVERPSDYLRLIEENRDELAALYADLLIGVTGFFRDHEPFEALKQVVLPVLLQGRSPERPLRVWVPGCASGEEAYSLAICMVEYLEEHRSEHKIQIFATDIDDHALAKARHGIYPQAIEAEVSPERLGRFFAPVGRGFQVSRKLRDLVVFARHNLGKDPPFSHLDLVSCRNLLIYLQPPLQKKAMRVFHYALNPGGYLLLGTAESVGDASESFALVERKLKLYVKKNNGLPGSMDFPLGVRPDGRVAAMTIPPSEPKPELSLQFLADRKILDKYGPPGVLVDDQLNILQFRGQTAPYLAPSPGAATLSVLRMVRPELLTTLKTAAQRALSEGTPISTEAVTFASGVQATMDMLPLEAGQARCLLILFRSLAASQEVAEAVPSVPEVAGSDNAPKRVHELERELSTTKEYLETIVQELATSNEELQSSNEEMQSSNEEMQSTNEELETSKEELQATNEELVTVNEELQTRIHQLGVANDDLINVLSNVSCPLVLVSLDMRIRRFSRAAEKLLHLGASDKDRSISYLGTVLHFPQLEAKVGETIRTMQASETRVRGSDGRWYTLRMVPYQTADRAIRGAVMEFDPVFLSEGAAEQLPELDKMVSEVLSMLPHQVVVLDQGLRIVWLNDAFSKAWECAGDVWGQRFDVLLPRDPALVDLWRAIEGTALAWRPFEDVTTEGPIGTHPKGRLRWSGRCLEGENERGPLAVITLQTVEG